VVAYISPRMKPFMVDVDGFQCGFKSLYGVLRIGTKKTTWLGWLIGFRGNMYCKPYTRMDIAIKMMARIKKKTICTIFFNLRNAGLELLTMALVGEMM